VTEAITRGGANMLSNNAGISHVISHVEHEEAIANKRETSLTRNEIRHASGRRLQNVRLGRNYAPSARTIGSTRVIDWRGGNRS
jgi:hypothetical protein